MFDVYRNGTRDLLVLISGSAVPGGYSASKWAQEQKVNSQRKATRLS